MRIKLRDGKTAKAATEKKRRVEQWLNCGPPARRWEGKRKKKTKTEKIMGKITVPWKTSGKKRTYDGWGTAEGRNVAGRAAANYCGQIVGTRRRCASLPTNREQPSSSRTLNPRRQRAAKRNEIDLVSTPLPPAHRRTRFSWRIYAIMSRVLSTGFSSFPRSPPPHLPSWVRVFLARVSEISSKYYSSTHTSITYRRRPCAFVCRGREESLGKKKRGRI